ncbi:centrosomal protein of 295 kDa isoform X3 [Danio rerio]|uniref:Centrosomal protein of 295 kDa isoform X3 n=1 Tax=Danio rerio TaxID=7955 RepID=A0AC58HEA7_DANRE
MRRKESRVKLSPNEEEQLLREELDRRRKLRLQQVREQERFIAAQVRRQVQERRQKQLQTLADSLQQHWQQQHTHRLQALHTHYQRSLSAVGEGHRSATHNEPDEQCVSQKRVERQERANERHREALRELNTRRHEEQQQQRRLMEARRRALLEEKRRTQRVCSLPPPPPDPLEGVVLKTPRPLRSTAAELVSITHTAVDRETDTQPQQSAQQAAAQESERLEDLQREQDEEQQQRLQRARERGEHALRREQHTQDRARLLCDLQRLQHADLQRRSQALHSVPAQVFQPLYRQQELRDQQQRDLEIAFQDLYTHQRKVKGDWLLQLVPEPLPPLSAASHDEELDVTLDPCETPPTDSPESSADPGRRALSTLLERIRSRREPRTGEEESGGVEEEEDQSAGVEEKQNTGVEEPATTDGPDVSDDAVVAGHLLPADHTHTQVEETAERQSGAHTHIQEAVLRQQEEQLALLEELEEQRRELQQQLTHTLHTLQEPEHQQEEISSTHPEPPAQAESDTLRLHQYQQRLLQQNRLHRQFIAEAQRRLQEHQQSLRTHSSMSSATETTQKSKRICVSLQLREQSLSASAHTPAGGSASAHTGGSPQDSHTKEEHAAPEPDTLPLPPSLPLPTTFPTSLPASVPPSFPLRPSLPPALPASLPPSLAPSLPLPPPAVVLELLRSRHHHTPLQSAEVTGSGSGSASSSGPGSVHQMRRQRDALQALIAAHTQSPVSSSADQPMLNTLLSLITESDDQRDAHTLSDGAPAAHTHTADGVCAPAPVHRGRVCPPVSRPPVRLAFLQQMEQHELSAIQEVDSPANLSLDTGVQEQESVSSSVSLPVCLVSEDELGQSEGSQLTGRISRMSWRHTLMQESRSASQSSVKKQQLLDPGCLSSTTISTGSFSSSEHESLSFTTADAGHAPSSSSGRGSRDAVQEIIEKYSEELSASLTHTGAVSSSWSSVLQEESLHDGDAHTSGVFRPLQPHPDIDSSSSSSRGAVRDEQSSRAQGWSQMVSSVLERLSEQLSVTHTHSEHTRCAAASGVALQTRPSSSSSSSSSSSAADAGVCSSQVCVQSAAGTEEEEEHPDDPSAVFLPLPTEVTLNQSVDLSPLHAELAVSDWLESADQSHHALQQMRSEPQAEPQAETSADSLSITHESLCEAENSSMSAPQEEDPPAQEVMSAVKESTLTELLERAQAAGELKGILEESVLSFISLPESESSAAAQDEELSRAEEQHSAQSEPAFPHAVMLLEAQCSPAQRLHRARLAQRSALRAAQIKHTHRRNTTHIPHNPSTTHTQPTSASDGLKSVCEVRICTEEHRRQQEAEMLQRTHRLYSQLEEVKQRKQMQIRQQSNANNRERARDFHRKTLENLRARPKS